MIDGLTAVLRTYTRAFLSQAVGVIGLAWCLAEAQAGFAVLLTVLVLADQMLFLRGRFGSGRAFVPGGALLDGWCLAVSAVDVLLCLAAVFRATGLRDSEGTSAGTALDGLAFVIDTLAHGHGGVVAATAAGRLLAAILAGVGDLALVAGIAVAAGFAVRRRP